MKIAAARPATLSLFEPTPVGEVAGGDGASRPTAKLPALSASNRGGDTLLRLAEFAKYAGESTNRRIKDDQKKKYHDRTTPEQEAYQQATRDLLNNSESDRELNWKLFDKYDRKGHFVGERLAACGRFVSSNPRGTGGLVHKVTEKKLSQFSGYQTCGSIHACPVCAPKIRMKRGKEIEKVVRAWLMAGKVAMFPTFTMRHNKGMTLKETERAIADSWGHLLQGSARRKLQKDFNFHGWIKANDLTIGEANGWHFHLHNVLLLDIDRPESEEDLERLAEDLQNTMQVYWDRAMVKLGYEKTEAGRGVYVEPVKDAEGLGRYVSKIANELTRQDLKKKGKGRSPWQLLHDARMLREQTFRAETAAKLTGEIHLVDKYQQFNAKFKQEAALWAEYCKAMKGKKGIAMSQGLKEEFGIEEKSDEELAQEKQDHRVIAQYGAGLAKLFSQDLQMRFGVYRAGEIGGTAQVRHYLEVERRLPLRIHELPHEEPPPGGDDPPELEAEPPPPVLHFELLTQGEINAIKLAS